MSGQITFGGKGCWRRYAKGDFLVFLQHVNGEESIVLAPRRRAPGAGVFVVGLSSATHYFDSRSGLPTDYCMRVIGDAIEAMGMNRHDRYAVRGVIDCLYEYLPDLVMMPPDLDGMKAPKGVEAVELFVNGERAVTREVAH